ncbi:hypothetical protein D3C77_349280 [compost metagenome]
MDYNEQQLKDLMSEGATNAQIAQFFGFSERTARRRKAELALKGHSPEHGMTRMVPDGYKVKGVSSYYNKDGALTGQWVKSSIDADRQREMIAESFNALRDELPQIDARPYAGSYLPDLMACYPIGDPHIGEYIWSEECGKSWDLAIAERMHCSAMAALVEAAPRTESCTIVNLGDAAHYDSIAAVTPRSGHHLDADSRYAKMVRVLVKVIRQCIETALTKHKTVHIINVPGNHDETGALWLSTALSHIYENEPRVTVDISPALFSYFEFGNNLIGTHHGHTCKADKLGQVMAADKPEAWGRTKHRAWWTGHVHHESKKEYPGCTVETFNTLAPGDAYATAGGWRSREHMKCVVLHREHGEVARHTVHPDMLK